MGRSLRHSLYLLALAGGLTFAAGVVFAQALPSVVPVSISPSAPAPGGLQTMATYQATGAGAANGYYTRPVLVSNNTLGGLARGLLRRSVPVAAMLAAIEAAGWVIDELTGQVMSGPREQSSVPPGTPYYSYSSGDIFYFSSWQSLGAHRAAAYQAQYPQFAPVTVGGVANCSTVGANGSYSCDVELIRSNSATNTKIRGTYFPNDNPGSTIPLTPTRPAPEPVPDSQLGQVVRDNPQLHNDALRNPDGSVNRNPDVMAAADALAQELAAGDPLPDPTAEWDTGQQGGDPQQAPASDLPAFCTWAAKVCQLADWLMDDGDEEPAPVDLPVIEPDTAVSWNSGLGGGSCPADISVGNVMGAEVVFPLSGFCLAADMIRPLVLAAAALLALLIVGGFRHAS